MLALRLAAGLGAIDNCARAPGVPPAPDDLECHCCQRTLASMQRYCAEQKASHNLPPVAFGQVHTPPLRFPPQNMGDLEMASFDCATEMDPEPVPGRIG